MEAAALGTFMVSACAFGVLLPHFLADGFARRFAAGIAMGLTAVAIIYSPWGQRSGAQMNPALTLAYLTIGKIAPWDAVFYAAAQTAGGTAGVVLSRHVFGRAVADANYVATVPGDGRSVDRPCGRIRDLVFARLDRSACSELAPLDPGHPLGGGLPRGHVHHVRIAAVRHEYESGSDVRFGSAVGNLDGILALSGRTFSGDDCGR